MKICLHCRSVQKTDLTSITVSIKKDVWCQRLRRHLRREQSVFAKPNIPPRPHVHITVSCHMSIVQSITLDPINKQHLIALCLLVRLRTVPTTCTTDAQFSCIIDVESVDKICITYCHKIVKIKNLSKICIVAVY